MSKSSKKRSYEVGYCKPPREHQFKKGEPSPNPRGRPRKKEQPASSVWTPIALGKSVDGLLIKEARREVWAWEGDRAESIPMIQAAIRQTALKAMQGDLAATRLLLSAVREIEQEERKQHSEDIQAMRDYKEKWSREIERAEERGETPPDPVPHPDDIIIDFKTGDVHVNGPFTEEQRDVFEEILERIDDAQESITMLAQEIAQEDNPERREVLRDLWKNDQRHFDLLNDMMPKRYARVLRDRCHDADASKPGEQKTFTWFGE